MRFKFYKNFWTLPFNTRAKISDNTFPFFIVGSPISKICSSEFHNFINFNLDLLFFPNVSDKFGKANQIRFSSKKKVFRIISPSTRLGKSCSTYKFSSSITYSLLLESCVKDSSNYFPYFQFFYLLSELLQNSDIEQEVSSLPELETVMFNFSEFTKFIYFVGFGSNILVNYYEFKCFIDFWIVNFNINANNSNFLFIINFLCGFFRKLLCNYLEIHIIV